MPFSPPGSRDYGLLSVLLQHVADPRIGLYVDRHVFTPPPEVQSAALVLEMLDTPRGAVRDEQRFRTLVKSAFQQRRKTLWNAIKKMPGAREVPTSRFAEAVVQHISMGRAA